MNCSYTEHSILISQFSPELLMIQENILDESETILRFYFLVAFLLTWKC